MSANATRKLKRLLVISWALPPLLSARSLQVGRMLHSLAEKGWEVDVISVDARSVFLAKLDQSLNSQYIKLLNVYRVPEPLFRLPKMALAKLFPSMLSLPDTDDPWVKRATVAGKQLLQEKNYQALLTFGQPWTSHIVGLNLKKVSDLPWLAHFSDPWADNPYQRSLNADQKAAMLALENKVVAGADKVIFTNKPAARMEMRKYARSWVKKIAIIPHAFDRKVIKRSLNSQNPTPRVRFVYTGNLYGLRNPLNLILSLEGLGKGAYLTLELAGRIKDVERYKRLANRIGVGEMIKFRGQMNYTASLKLASEADVLLLIDAPSKESPFLPSKLIDYLMFDKPILGITPKRGAAADLLHQLGYPIAAPDSVGAITTAMRRLIKQWRSHKLRISKKHHQVARRYEIKQVSGEFEALINLVIG